MHQNFTGQWQWVMSVGMSRALLGKPLYDITLPRSWQVAPATDRDILLGVVTVWCYAEISWFLTAKIRCRLETSQFCLVAHLTSNFGSVASLAGLKILKGIRPIRPQDLVPRCLIIPTAASRGQFANRPLNIFPFCRCDFAKNWQKFIPHGMVFARVYGLPPSCSKWVVNSQAAQKVRPPFMPELPDETAVQLVFIVWQLPCLSTSWSIAIKDTQINVTTCHNQRRCFNFNEWCTYFVCKILVHLMENWLLVRWHGQHWEPQRGRSGQRIGLHQQLPYAKGCREWNCEMLWTFLF